MPYVLTSFESIKEVDALESILGSINSKMTLMVLISNLERNINFPKKYIKILTFFENEKYKSVFLKNAMVQWNHWSHC